MHCSSGETNDSIFQFMIASFASNFTVKFSTGRGAGEKNFHVRKFLFRSCQNVFHLLPQTQKNISTESIMCLCIFFYL